MISGVSRPATHLAKELDRIPDGEYIVFLIKRSRPQGWTVVIQAASTVRELEIRR